MKHLRNQQDLRLSTADRPFKYVSKTTNKQGKTYFYYQEKKSDKKQYFKSDPGTVDFLLEYNSFRNIDVVKKKVKPKKTIQELISLYRKTNHYLDLADRTKTNKKTMYNWMIKNIPEADIKGMTPMDVEAIMQKKAGAEAANKVKKELNVLFKHAQTIGWVPQGFNPAALANKRKHEVKGYHTWTAEEIEAYEKTHPPGSEARFYLNLFMVTGASRTDAIAMGWHNVKDGQICFARSKTTQERSITIPKFLMKDLERIPKSQKTFLVNQYGKPFGIDGIGSRFKKFVEEAGIPHCTIHGLRKAMAVKLAHGGLSKHVIGAWLAHSGTDLVDTYTKDRDRKALIDEALEFLNWE